MSVFVIADLHLSTENASKSMEIFGNRWADYQKRIENNWNKLVGENDTVIIPGDISWSLKLEEAVPDLRFLDSLSGKKIIMKGNHDFWWTSLKKMNELFERQGFESISVLNNNAIVVENYIVTGSRGWFVDESTQSKNVAADFEKINNREAIRLKMGLDAALKLKEEHPDKEIIAFFHFPPVWNGFKNDRFLELLGQYGVKRCYFGHIHGNYSVSSNIRVDETQMWLISADFLNFIPFHV